MDIRDLRIDNILRCHGQLAEVTSIDSIGEVEAFFEDPWSHVMFPFFEYEPIRLTEEWLKAFGFKRFGNDFVRKGIFVHTRKRGYIIKKSVPMMEYVHQLQNYYYFSKGEELSLDRRAVGFKS